jgi:hypothetical protein
LVESQVVLNDGNDIAPYSVDVGVHGQMRNLVACRAAKNWFILRPMITEGISLQQRPALSFLIP